MATGRNTESISDLGKEFNEYKSPDLEEDDEDDKRIQEDLTTGTDERIRDIITACEFTIEESETPFCEDCGDCDTTRFLNFDTGATVCKCNNCNAENDLA
jgi:hypothetical protein